MHWLTYLFIATVAVSVFTWLPSVETELVSSGPAGIYALYFGTGMLVLLGLLSWLYLYEHIRLRSAERLPLILAGFVIAIPLVQQVSRTLHLPTHVDIVRNLQSYDSALAHELEPGYLLIEGQIGTLTLASIEAYATQHALQGLVLQSHGGLIDSAVDIADYLQRNAVDTYVFHYCESACVIIAVGGDRLFASPAARFGFHQASAPTRSSSEFAQAISIDGTIRMREVLAYYGIPSDILNAMAHTRNSDMAYFSGAELYHRGLVAQLLD